MRRGGELPEVTLAYETWGTLSPERDNVVVIFTGLSPDAHAASGPDDDRPGWWEDMVGPGRPFDTDRFHVICFNSLGSCFGSTGPASPNPDTGRRWGLDFPDLTVEDIAATAGLALGEMGIDRLHTVAGPSMGGMTALAFVLMHPGRADHLVSISSAIHALPFAIAIRSLQREMIRSDPDWRDGAFPEGGGPILGMRLARKLGMMSYRSPVEWEHRFGRDRVADDRRGSGRFGIEFEIESYLEAHARKFIGGFDANCYLYLSRCMDLFDAVEHGADAESAVGRAGLKKALVIGVETDFLFPIRQQRELANLLASAGVEVTFESLASVQGHDSFLVDMERFRPAVGGFMESTD